MRDFRSGKTWAGRMTASLLALLIPFAGLSFGEGHSTQKPAISMEEARLNSDDGPDASRQIGEPSRLAAKIEKKQKVLVVTPSGKTIIYWPVILEEGVASRMSNFGEKLTSGRYNQSSVIPWSEVRTIRIRTNLVGIGALVGFFFGAAAGYGLATGKFEAGGETGKMAGLAGGLLGMLPGVLLGSILSSWNTVYTAPAGSPPAPRISLVPTRSGGMALSVSLSF